MEITKQGNQIYIDSSFLEHVNNYCNYHYGNTYYSNNLFMYVSQ